MDISMLHESLLAGVDKGIGVLNCIQLHFRNLISQAVPVNY